MNMQKLILDSIKSAAEAKGFTVIQEPNWANTGHLRFLKTGAFNAKSVIYYNFQDNYAILTAKVNGEYLLPQAHRPKYYDYYMKYDNMDDLYNQLMAQLFSALA